MWSTEPFTRAQETLKSLNAHATVETVVQVLKSVSNDLQALLTVPPKSAASRTKLGSKSITLNGQELDLNDAFINDAARVADELDLDELAAAELVYVASADAQQLGLGAVEAAISTFYVRQTLIIDILRFSVESLPLDRFNLVFPAGKSRVGHILTALKAVEHGFDGLKEKAKAGEFTGQNKEPEFENILQIQRSFFVKEHEALGVLFSAYASAASLDAPEFREIMQHLSTFSTFDSRMLAYVPVLATWLTAPDLPIVDVVWNYFAGSSSPQWSLQYWDSGLALLFYTAIAGEDRPLPANITYPTIIDATRHAIDQGALEFWLALAQDLKAAAGDYHYLKFSPLVRSRVPRIVLWQPACSLQLSSELTTTFRTFCTEFITNLADILKEMRLSEEDMYLAISELEHEHQDHDAIGPGIDLERFFLLIAVSYHHDPGAGMVFFEDDGDALYGFLLWASECQVTFMAAAFAELLAALASDAKTSLAVHKFLTGLDTRNQANDSQFSLSWKSIYLVINYYIRGVSLPPTSTTTGILPPGSAQPVAVAPSTFATAQAAQAAAEEIAKPSLLGLPSLQDMSSSSNITTGTTSTTTTTHGSSSTPFLPATRASDMFSTSPQPQHIRLCDDTLLVLSSYMYLISQVAEKCDQMKQFVRAKSSTQDDTATNNKNEDVKDIVPLLFKLLRLELPLASSIFDALASLASPDMWPLLDGYVLGRFDVVLTSFKDALAFARMVAELARVDEFVPKRIDEYLEFILKHAFIWSVSGKHEEDTAQQETAKIMQLTCLLFLKALLFRTQPCQSACNFCFDAQVYGAIFSALTQNLDELNQYNANHPIVKCVTESVQVCLILLNFDSYSFDKPILYHLEIVPYIALYAGSKFGALASASIKLLAKLDESPEFKPTISRQSRILSILSSSSDAARIRVGLISRLGDNGTSVSIRAALISMLLNELHRSGVPKQYMSVAHYLLGFRQAELGFTVELELDDGIGGIETGASLLKVVCDILLNCLSELNAQNIDLIQLSTAILGVLCRDSLTSKLILDYLRPSEFWLKTIKLEPTRLPKTNISEFLDHRATLLEIWRSEMQMCQSRILLTVENHYLEALVPIIFALYDLSAPVPVDSNGATTDKSAALRCLQAWCDLIPVLIGSGNPLTGPAFVSRAVHTLAVRLPEYSRQSAQFAQPIASLLVYLFGTFTENVGLDYAVARNTLILFQSALQSVQPSLTNETLRTNVYELCVQYFKVVLSLDSRDIEQLALNELKVGGWKVIQSASEDVFHCVDESLRTGALTFLQLAATLARRLELPYIVDLILKSNFITILIQQFVGPIMEGKHQQQLQLQLQQQQMVLPQDLQQTKRNEKVVYHELMLALSLLLPVAQIRKGALEIVRAGYMDILDRCLNKVNDDTLLVSLQTLTTMILSLGPDYEEFLVQVRKLLRSHERLIEEIFDREVTAVTTTTKSLPGQPATLPPETPSLVKNFTILVSLARFS